MVSMNAVDVDVCKVHYAPFPPFCAHLVDSLQKILADYAASAVPAVVATGGVPAPTPPPVAVTPHPAVPPYLQQQQSSTPPGYRTHTPPTVPVAATPPIAPAGYQQYAGGYQQPPPSGPGGYGGYNQYQQQPPSHGHGGYASVPPGYPPYGGAPPAAAPPAAPTVPASVADALAAIPEEQKVCFFSTRLNHVRVLTLL